MIAAVERRKPVTTGVEAELRGTTIAVAFVMKVVGEGVKAVVMLRTVTGVRRSVVSPTPRLPTGLYPNVLTVPSAMRIAPN